MTYDELLEEVKQEGIELIEMPLKRYKGLYGDNTIALSKNLETITEKTCILVEELGHHHKTNGEIIDIRNINKVKQEILARRWGYERLIGIIDLVNAFNSGVKGRHELAEYLSVTEEFLEETLKYYKQKYGMYYEIDNYIVYFEPNLTVLKMF